MSEEVKSTTPLEKEALHARLISSDSKVRPRAVASLFIRPDLLADGFRAAVDNPSSQVRSLLVKLILCQEKSIPRELIEHFVRAELSSHVHQRGFQGVGLLAFLRSVKIGHLLSGSARDSQPTMWIFVLQSMRARFEDLAPKDIDKILRAQFESSSWRYRLLGVAYLEANKRVSAGKYVGLLAGETFKQVRKMMFRLVEIRPEGFAAANVKVIFGPEVTAVQRKDRMAAAMLLSRLNSGAEKDLLGTLATDEVTSVRQTARQALLKRDYPPVVSH